MDSSAKFLMLAGLGLFAIGVVWWLCAKYLNFGHLPGDIAIEKENFRFYFPLATSLLLSLVLSLLFWLFRR